jgi:hypothetical protein
VRIDLGQIVYCCKTIMKALDLSTESKLFEGDLYLVCISIMALVELIHEAASRYSLVAGLEKPWVILNPNAPTIVLALE